MRKLKEQFVNSWCELKHVNCIAITAMLIAVGVILGYFSVQVTDFLRIGFSGLANELAAFLFGPVVGGLMGGVGDILKYIMKPTGAFFFGWTLNAILGPMIYGIMLYHRPINLKRIFAAKILVALIVNLLLGTLWLSIMYGKAFFLLLPARAVKQLVSVPVDALLLYVVLQMLSKAKVFALVHSR